MGRHLLCPRSPRPFPTRSAWRPSHLTQAPVAVGAACWLCSGGRRIRSRAFPSPASPRGAGSGGRSRGGVRVCFKSKLLPPHRSTNPSWLLGAQSPPSCLLVVRDEHRALPALCLGRCRGLGPGGPGLWGRRRRQWAHPQNRALCGTLRTVSCVQRCCQRVGVGGACGERQVSAAPL